MSVTLTDEKHAELVRMLDTIVRGCDARAYDIGLSLDPLRELLGDVAALTREPAPADADAGTGNSSKGTVPHAPRCAVNTEPGDTALTEEECCTCGAMRPAPDVIDALNQPMISDHNIVATHRVVEPAPCPHREAFAAFRKAVELDCKCLAGRTCENCLITRAADSALQQPCAAPAGCQHRELLRKMTGWITHNMACEHNWNSRKPCTCKAEATRKSLDAALAQPCAAPGEAGEWEELKELSLGGGYLYLGSHIESGYDYRLVDGVVYRRRAPEREGGAR